MEIFVKTVDSIQPPLTIFAKHFLLRVSRDYENLSDKAKQNPGAMSFISRKIRPAISENFFHF